MSDYKRENAGALFWILGILFLVWNGFGCYSYWLNETLSTAAYTEAYGEAMTIVRDKYPAWSVAAYAIAVWGGLLAAILYLLRKKWAAPLFVLSFIAAIISFIWGLTNAEARAASGGAAWVMPVAVFLLGLLEVLWSRKKVADGTLS